MQLISITGHVAQCGIHTHILIVHYTIIPPLAPSFKVILYMHTLNYEMHNYAAYCNVMYNIYLPNIIIIIAITQHNINVTVKPSAIPITAGLNSLPEINSV